MTSKHITELESVNERFLLACENGDLPLARKMRDKGAEHEVRNTVGESAIHLAVKSGDVRLVDFVLQEMRVNPNLRDAFGRTALHWAAQQGNVDICESLLMYHANVEAKDDMGVEPKIYAEMGGHRKIVKMFNLVRNQQRR
jgi:ankyrin repeat protein